MLVVGSLLRVRFRVLQQLFIPAAIVGGLVGIVVLLIGQSSVLDFWRPDSVGPNAVQKLLGDVSEQLKTWPGQLIAVVFAGLLLERKSRSLHDSARLAWREGLVVWIIVLGQTTLGLLATWCLIQPFFDVPNSFGMLIETGFAGGHGTAAAMGEIFATDAVSMSDGRDLGMFMATVGLVISVISGMAYVNIAVRRGWTRAGDVEIKPIVGLEDRRNPPAVAHGTIRSEVIDPFAFQLIILTIAVAVGVALSAVVKTFAVALDDDLSADVPGILGSFPLFIYTLFGGLLVRKTMEWFAIDDLIDAASIQRIVGVAMEFLVVAAIVTLNITAVVRFALPLLILIAVAFVWTAFCLRYVSRWFLPQGYWFELGILNYGMSTGTTATGFVLLRVIDKNLDSRAAEDYALAAPLSSPFIGGGLLTVGFPLLLEQVHIAVPSFILCCLMGGLFLLAKRFARDVASDS